MPTEPRALNDWDALRAHISATYQEVTEFAHEFLRFRVRRGEDATWIKLRILNEEGPTWIYFLSKVCPESAVDPRVILHRSGVTPIGELSLFGDFVVVGQRVPLAGLNTQTVETIVNALVTERALILKELVKDPGASGDPVFSHLTE